MHSALTDDIFTFQTIIYDSTFINLFDNFGNEIIHIVDVDRYVIFDPSIFASIRALKVRSGTSGTPVNQGAARVIQLLSRTL